MAKRKRAIPQYGTVVLNGIEYYRTRVEDSDGNRVALYAKTPEKLYDKELEALEQIDSTTFRRRSPTVAEYCEKWLLMQSVHVRATTLTDYASKVRRHIIGGLGEKRMADVTLDDIQLALVPVSKKSASVYKSVVILCKSIFQAAKESHVIDEDPTIFLDAKGGGVPQEERQALTDEQVKRLLDTIRDLPPYVFVMIGLYAGLRREEILALQWDSVYLDAEAPYLTVRRAWHTEHNRPVILTELKTKAAQRNIPLPVCLVECLKEAKKKSTSDYVIANRDGDPLSYTQFKRLWQYIVTRTAKPRMARKLVDGKYVKYKYCKEVMEHEFRIRAELIQRKFRRTEETDGGIEAVESAEQRIGKYTAADGTAHRDPMRSAADNEQVNGASRRNELGTGGNSEDPARIETTHRPDAGAAVAHGDAEIADRDEQAAGTGWEPEREVFLQVDRLASGLQPAGGPQVDHAGADPWHGGDGRLVWRGGDPRPVPLIPAVAGLSTVGTLLDEDEDAEEKRRRMEAKIAAENFGAAIGFAAGAALTVKEKLDEHAAQGKQQQTMGGL